MNNKGYHYSVFGTLIEDMIHMRISMGYKSHDYMFYLNDFDKYAEEERLDRICITKDIAEGFCRERPNESDKTRYNRICVFNRFSLYLRHLGYESYIVYTPKVKSSYTPYIFSEEQIERIFNVADQLCDDIVRPHSGLFAMPVLLRVLYSTGIRTGEALNLNIDDVNLKDNCFILRGCKNGEDRMVPFSQSLAEVIHEYLSNWNVIPVNNQNKKFFISYEGYPLNRGISYNWFRKILFLAGIPHGGRGHGPRLHDLRHTHSVHALVSLGKQGLDLYVALPILSTYLGHKSLSSTNRYVRLTANMYPSLIKSMNNAYPYMYPEINECWKDETY